MARRRIVTIGEFSIHPIGKGTSTGEYVAAALREMRRVKGIRLQLTPMSTVFEARDVGTILTLVEKAHAALVRKGAKRISSLLRIDQRLDKTRRMEDKVTKVSRLLKGEK